MKKILFCLFFFVSFVAAKAQFEYEGHVFYDAEQTKAKEIYHYILRYRYSIDRATGDTVISDTPTPVRHGVCILYREDGTIEATGQYDNGRRAGKWLFYKPDGKTVLREEVY